MEITTTFVAYYQQEESITQGKKCNGEHGISETGRGGHTFVVYYHLFLGEQDDNYKLIINPFMNKLRLYSFSFKVSLCKNFNTIPFDSLSHCLQTHSLD